MLSVGGNASLIFCLISIAHHETVGCHLLGGQALLPDLDGKHGLKIVKRLGSDSPFLCGCQCLAIEAGSVSDHLPTGVTPGKSTQLLKFTDQCSQWEN